MTISRMLIIVAIAIPALQSCKKEKQAEEPLPFQWVKEGNVLHYDYYTDSGTIISDHRTLTIRDNRFEENDPGASFYHKIFQLPYEELRVDRTGLNVVDCGDCRFSMNGCMDEFTSVYAPVDPVAGMPMPQYDCSRIANGLMPQVIAIDTTITVPLGSFKTYVVQLEQGDRVFWNANEGIIIYNRMDGVGGRLIGSLKLSKRSW